MRGIGLRLVGGFLLVIAMMIALALYSVTVSRQSLTESIGTSSVFSAEDMMGSIDRSLERRIEQSRISATGSWFRLQVEESNRTFDAMANREGFMQLRTGNGHRQTRRVSRLLSGRSWVTRCPRSCSGRSSISP
jgi:hypothetical protein